MATSIKKLGVQTVAIKADAYSPDFGKTLVEAALKAFNTDTIDIVVNNAGTAAAHPEGITSVPFEDWDKVFHVNVRAPFVLVQAALPHMKEGGRIVNIGSTVAQLGHQWLSVYAASKGALSAMTVSMAQELGPKGITINLVSPGPIKTAMAMTGTPIFNHLMNSAYIKREGEPREVGDVVAFVASPMASYMTGQNIPVDGGIWIP